MNNFYITHHSLGYIGPAILALIFSLAIFHRQYKSGNIKKATLSLGTYFFFHGIYNLLNLTGFSWYTPDSQYVWYIETLMSFAVLFLLYFAYQYPEERFPKERKIVIVIFAVLAAAAAGEYFYFAPSYPVSLFGQTYGSEYFSRYVPVVIGLIYSWTIVVFLRKMYLNEKEKNSSGNIILMFIKPKTPEAKTARSFAMVIFFEVMYSVFIFSVMNTADASEKLAVYITTALLLYIYSAYIMIYLISAYQNIPFIYKLTGIPVVFTLFILITIGYSTMHFRSLSYDEMNLALISRLDINEIQNNEKLTIPVYYVCEMEPDGTCRLLRSDGDEKIHILSHNIWESVPSGNQIRKNLGVLDYSELEENKRYFSQTGGVNFLVYFRKGEGKIYGFGIPYVNFLNYMDRIGSYMLLLIVVTMILIIIVLPMLYYFGIIAPLNQIINPDKEKKSSETEFDRISKIVNELKTNVKERQKKESGQYSLTPQVRSKLDRVIDYISDNFKEEISREGLSAMVELDTDYMSKLFKIYTGMKIGDFVGRLRVEEACRLLSETDDKVIDISLEVGYESLRSFNRAFSKVTGMTPSQYKRN